jgi:hypothetical protein
LEFLEERTLLSRGPVLPVGSGSHPPDDPGDSLATAAWIALDRTGSACQRGSIDYGPGPGPSAGDVDTFRFVAPVTGPLMLRESAAFSSSLAAVLNVFDGSPAHAPVDLGFNLAGDGHGVQVVFPVTAGQTYFVQTAGLQGSTGAYDLTFNSFAGPGTVVLDGSGAGSRAGTINRPGSAGLFRFAAPVTGVMTVRQEGAPRSRLDSVLTAFDGAWRPLAFNDDRAPDTRDSEVRFLVKAGQTYYVQAAGYDTSTGAYRLTWSTAPAPADPFAGALPLVVGPVASVPGYILSAGDADYYRFTAPGTGRALVALLGGGEANLDGSLAVFDGSPGHAPLVSAGHFDPDSGFLRFLVPVTAGQTYFVRAGAAGDSRGPYRLITAFLDPASADGSVTVVGTAGGHPPAVSATIAGTAEEALSGLQVSVPLSPTSGRHAMPPVAPALAVSRGVVPPSPGDAGRVPVADPPRVQISALGPRGEPALVFVATLLVGRHPSLAPGVPDHAATTESAAARVGTFQADTSGRGRSVPPNSGTAADGGPRAALDEALAHWVPPVGRLAVSGEQFLAESSLLVLRLSAPALRSACRLLGGEALQVLDAFWEGLADGLLQLGVPGTRAVGEKASSLRGPVRPAAPARPRTGVRLPGPPEEGGKGVNLLTGALVVWAGCTAPRMERRTPRRASRSTGSGLPTHP